MAEVEGSIILQIDNEEKASLVASARDGVGLDQEFFLTLCDIDGVNLQKMFDDFSPDGDTFTDGVFSVDLFGEDTVELLEAMLKSSRINWWASLWHEYGMEYFFVCTPGKKQKYFFDFEGGDYPEGALEQAREEWLSTMPEKLRSRFDFDDE